MQLAPEGYTKSLRSVRRAAHRPCLVTVPSEDEQVDYVVQQVLANREAGLELREQAVLFRTGHHSARLELELGRRNIPFVKFGGLKFVETAHVKDLLAFLRLAENPRDRVAAFRVLQLLPGIGPGTARRALALLEAGNFDFAALNAVQPPRSERRAVAGAGRAPAHSGGVHHLGGPARTGARVLRSSARGAVRASARPARRSGRARPDRRDLSVARAVPHRAHPRSARGGGRRGRRTAARRRLSDPLDHPLGQGPGVAGGVRAERGRRLHPVRHGDRLVRRDRGGASRALRRHDPRARPAASDPPPSLRGRRPAVARGPLCARAAQPLHSGPAARPVRSPCARLRRCRGGARATLAPSCRGSTSAPCWSTCGAERASALGGQPTPGARRPRGRRCADARRRRCQPLPLVAARWPRSLPRRAVARARSGGTKTT